jgi:hypothetical protein
MKTQKILSILLLLVFSYSFTYAEYGEKYFSNVDRLNIRIAPSASSKII